MNNSVNDSILPNARKLFLVDLLSEDKRSIKLISEYEIFVRARICNNLSIK